MLSFPPPLGFPRVISHIIIIIIITVQLIQRLGYWLDDRGSIPGKGMEFLLLPPRPDLLWGPTNLPNGYMVLFSWR
jgi:hypothetical protein